jgi:hypothetical protein
LRALAHGYAVAVGTAGVLLAVAAVIALVSVPARVTGAPSDVSERPGSRCGEAQSGRRSEVVGWPAATDDPA